jgi:hypothetical protein
MSTFNAVWGQFDVIWGSIEREISGVERGKPFGIIVETEGGGRAIW